MNYEQRKSNIELLRIIAMIFIIFSHLSSHSNINIISHSFNSVYLQFIQTFGKIGVNIFVFISGYFLINQDKLKIDKIIKLWIQMFFYSVVLYIIISIISNNFSIIELIKNIIPITSKRWWFASTYFILYIFSPYINKLLKSLNKNEYKQMLVFLTVIWVIIPTITQQDMECNNLLWFFYLYSLSGFFKLYYSNIVLSKKVILLFLIISFLVSFVFILICNNLNIDYKLFFGIQRIPTFIISILIFLLFKEVNIPSNNFINAIAKTTFGIYLIHDYYLVRNLLWQYVFDIKNIYYNYPLLSLVLYSILCVGLVFIITCIIEYFRKRFEIKIENNLKRWFYDQKNI